MNRTVLGVLLVVGTLLLGGNARASVVINEILYHPSNSAVLPGEDPEDLQFIELYNTGPGAADLAGASFAQGVTYAFPAGTTLAAGAYLVVARSPALLALRGPAIPGGVTVVQWTTGDLANGGETIQLVDATANVLDEVTYDDAGLWPAAADGAGATLELTNPTYDNTQPLVWRGSVAANGTPGATNSQFTEGPIILAEVPARGSIVPSLADVSITFAEPVSGVAAGNLVVDGSPATSVSCDTCVGGVGAGPWVFGGFAAPTSNPYTLTLAAGAIRDGQANAFAGDSWFYSQSVPNVVINEVHYNPNSSTDIEEFIELINADVVAVDISGWRLAEFGSPGCTFPANTIVPPGAYVVCAKDPVALQTATGYLAAYSWGLNDSLSNGGEPIALLDSSGTVVDRIVYSDAPPWPTGAAGPDGGGPSMELTNPAVDNSDGQAWRASTTVHGTPGARNSTYSDVPAIASVTPGRGAVIVGLTEISVTFTEPVTGVTADDLTVGDVMGGAVAATGVTGEGAGPYVFTVVDPGAGIVEVVVESAAIRDLQGTAFPGDSWLYFHSLPRIVINEIHYNPSASTVAAGEDAEQLQFIELYNDEAQAVDLSGYSVAAGVNFVFPAGTSLASGAYLVLAENGAFLRSKVTIPAGVQVLDWTSGDLSNGGENLEIADAYGHSIDEVRYDDDGDWTDGPDGRGPSLELVNPGLANDGAGAWQTSTVDNGTPGAANSVYRLNPAPIVYGAVHSPSIPTGGQTVTITASAIDDGGPPVSVTLYYRQDQNPPIAYSSTPMLDDGLHGDGAAGDGRYGASVPGLANGNQLDFYIEAADEVGASVAPSGHAVANRFGYPSQTYLCKFSDEVLPTDFPVYHILVTLNNKANQEALSTYPARKEHFDATFIDGAGNIWYNVKERFRGQSSLFKFPSSYRVDFPRNRKLDSALGFPVEALQLNGMRPAAQWMGFNLFNRAGLPAPRVAWARVRYPGINYDTCCRAQNGYYGLHVVVERLDNEFLDSQGGAIPERGLSSEGNLYRGRNDANFRWEGTNPATYGVNANGQSGYEKYNNETADFWGDVISVCDALSNTPDDQYVNHVNAHVDADKWAKYFALHMLVGNREGGLYLDTGDDYFVYFPPPADPLNPVHPDYATTQLPGDRTSGRSVLIPWDTDSAWWDNDYTIWRTAVPAAQRFLRNNAYAPIFVQAIEDFAANEVSLATMSELIDGLPDAAFGTSEGSDRWPETKQQYKNWIARRLAYVRNETIDTLTLVGGPWITHEGPDPVITLNGRLQQAGTHNITVNGGAATFNVYQATWSYDLDLGVGANTVLVQAWDRDGNEKDRIEAYVFYNPPGAFQLHVEMRAPKRMVNDKTVTIEAAITDSIGRVSYTQWDALGTVSVVRLPARTPVAITPTVFDSHLPVPDDAIRFVNGWGSVSFTLDEGAAFAPGDIEITVDWEGLDASRTVTVLQNPTFRNVSGTLTGANLVWGPNENIRVTGSPTVPAGSTLTIHPGTIVQVNTTGALQNGTLFTVRGAVQALGTRDAPIFFFSERGASAMTLTQSGSASNGNAWRGFQFYGTQTSTLRHVILTGAGNGNVVSHPRPPILGFFNTHSIFVDRCVFADNDGMVFSGQGTGTYRIRKTLISRAGIGGEFFGNGHTLDIRDSWFTGVGHAPEANNLDGDLLHIDGAASTQLIRSCIVTDGGDDGIDHNGSNFRLEHSIIHGIRDKAVSMTGGHADVHNTLMFSAATGIRGVASTSYTTLAVSAPIATADVVQTSVIWPSSIPTCTGTVNYTDVGAAGDLGCGTGNLSTDPQFTDRVRKDYNPRPGSPALTAGPNQDRIGWLGFPYGSVCATTADCDDTNACTADVCVNKLCTFTPIVGCTPCDIDEDCDDGDACTVDTCAADSACEYSARPDGTSCDDGKGCTSPDACAAGVCAGPENCPGGGQCGADGECVGDGGSITFRQDLNGYTGTHDTYLMQSQAGTAHGAETTWRWDTTDPSPSQSYGLVRFADIFGSGPFQIPTGSRIVSATLTLFVEDPTVAPAGDILEVLASWDEATATWNAFGGDAGVQADEIGTSVGFAPLGAGAFTVDVRSSLAAWSADPNSNYGWIFRPASGDGTRITSSEGAIVSNRPQLVVSFIPPVGGCTGDVDCDDGLYCNGAETCALVTGECVVGGAPDCDDAVSCTVDACDEVADTCTHGAADVLCDDGNVCTDDTCDGAAGCRNVNNTASCDDDDACTTVDVCASGVCTGGVVRSCNDGVECTADACDGVSGCTHTDACQAGQVCSLANGTCEDGPTVVTFQDGQNGYSGTIDTFVHAGMPDASNATSPSLIVDGPTPPEDERQILIRFEDIFGNGPGQVPKGARIVSATLTMFVTSPSDDGAGVYQVLVPWNDTATWNELGDGVQLDGTEALATAEATGASNANQVWFDLDVTASLLAWSGGDEVFGWVFVMPETGSDSWQFASSEELDGAMRPKLTVTFLPCEPGYVGDGVACLDLDECQEDPGPCDPNAVCTNQVGSFECDCKSGYAGDGLSCVDVDECQEGQASCAATASCTNTPGSYDCTCDPGYTGDGVICLDVDECHSGPNPCDATQTCRNLVGSFECVCGPGYEADGDTCVDIDECATVAGLCDVNATCDNTGGSYTCTCNPGFAGDGRTCGDLDECFAEPCGANAECVNMVGTYACLCVAGYVGDGIVCAECLGGAATPCNGHGTCTGTAQVPDCSCDPGYDGAACDECAPGFFGYPDCTTCPDCSDGNPCTTDSCDGPAGCVHEPNTATCNDGNACTTGDVCADGSCGGTAIGCDDGNPCTTDSCDPATGCVREPNSLPCDDGNACTTNDTCSGRACGGTGVNCDDGNPCTLDACDSRTGCVYTAVDACCSVDTQCAPPGRCMAGVCDPVAHACVAPTAIDGCCTADADCDDGDDGTLDSCEAGTGTCNNVLPCSGAAECDDGDPCTADVCELGVCASERIAECCISDGECDDGDPCTVDACQGNACVVSGQTPGCCRTDADCDDGDPATEDVCQATTGVCRHTSECTFDGECVDGDPCTVDACRAGACASDEIPGCCVVATDCDDGNPGTDDACDAATNTCSHVERCTEDAHCDDGDPCTVDGCRNGDCVSSEPLPGCCVADGQCDDGDPTTTDACDLTSNTCSHVAPCANDAECDDGDPCTVDRCRTGGCLHSEPLPECCRADVDCDVPAERCRLQRCVAVLCSLCDTDADCGAAGNLCLDYTSGSHCGVACTEGGVPCPDDAECLPTDGGTSQCQPAQGDCTCVPHASKDCSDGDLVWFTSCGDAEGVADDCAGRGCVAGECCVEGTHDEGGACVEDVVTPDVVVGPDASGEDVREDVGVDSGVPDVPSSTDTGQAPDAAGDAGRDAAQPKDVQSAGDAEDGGKTGSGGGSSGCSAADGPPSWFALLALLLALALPLARARRRERSSGHSR